MKRDLELESTNVEKYVASDRGSARRTWATFMGGSRIARDRLGRRLVGVSGHGTIASDYPSGSAGNHGRDRPHGPCPSSGWGSTEYRQHSARREGGAGEVGGSDDARRSVLAIEMDVQEQSEADRGAGQRGVQVSSTDGAFTSRARV